MAFLIVVFHNATLFLQFTSTVKLEPHKKKNGANGETTNIACFWFVAVS